MRTHWPDAPHPTLPGCEEGGVCEGSISQHPPGKFFPYRFGSKALRPGTWRTFKLSPEVKLYRLIVFPAEANLPAFDKTNGDSVRHWRGQELLQWPLTYTLSP